MSRERHRERRSLGDHDHEDARRRGAQDAPRRQPGQEVARASRAADGERADHEGLCGEPAHQEEPLALAKVGGALERRGIEVVAGDDRFRRDALLGRREQQDRALGDDDERREAEPRARRLRARDPATEARDSHPLLR